MPASFHAQAIVDKIIDDMTDRRGLRQEWDGFDDDIQREIREEWERIVDQVLTSVPR